MATLAEAEQASSDLDALTTLMAAEFAAQTTDLADVSPDQAASLLRDLAAELADEYGRVASLLAAEWYEEVRPAPGFDAALVEPDIDVLQRNMGWALREVYVDEPDVAAATAHSAEVADLAVTDASRATILTNARRDPLDVRYSRHASATACAFCRTLATRQAVYRSEDTAGVRAHRSCHCIAVPVWPGQKVEEAAYVDEWREAYHAATKKVGTANLKAILAEIRRTTGAR